jgi:hypothetical protein
MLKNVVSMTKAAADGNCQELSLYFRDLLPCVLRVLQSPLAAPYLSTLYIELRKCVFFTGGHKYLGNAFWFFCYLFNLSGRLENRVRECGWNLSVPVIALVTMVLILLSLKKEHCAFDAERPLACEEDSS